MSVSVAPANLRSSNEDIVCGEGGRNAFIVEVTPVAFWLPDVCRIGCRCEEGKLGVNAEERVREIEILRNKGKQLSWDVHSIQLQHL